MCMKKYAIIVAGGQGQRLGSEIPKQFISINHRPILFYTLEKFHGIADEIILVLPASHIDFWFQLCTDFDFNSRSVVVHGGSSRSESVMNGLKVLNGEGIVAIHDAVRPLVSRELILKLFSEAELHGNAIPVLPARDSLRMLNNQGSKAVNRDQFVAVQTPQCFNSQLIMDSYVRSGNGVFTDDATVFENSGGNIHLVQGENQNIKITFREDIALAESLLNAIKM